MIWLLDIGNSRVKWARWNGTSPVDSISAEGSVAHESLADVLIDEPPQRMLVSNVAGANALGRLSASLPPAWPEPEVQRVRTEVSPVTLAYKEPQALGVDRWLTMVAAWERFQRGFVVVGVGTALTMDAVDAGGRHLGGTICPGVYLMRKALAAANPVLDVPEVPTQATLGTSTESCIYLGSWYAMAGAVEYFYDKVSRSQGGLSCLLTGGDARRLLGYLRVRAQLSPDLVLQGLAIAARI